MNFYNSLLKKINKKSANIGIIGLGYVGLPLALSFSNKKFKVTGYDIDKMKLNNLNKNNSYIKHIPNSMIKKNSANLLFTSNFNLINNNDVIILCLPTPITKKNEPDLSFILTTINLIKRSFRKGQLIILESSTYPGSTRKMLTSKLKNFKLGNDFFLGYSPEREDPNNKNYNLSNIPKICSGYSVYCQNLVKTLYKKIVKKTVMVESLEIAEFAKLYENIYRSVNIGLVNELKIIAQKLNLDIYKIIDAAKTKPFGFQAFYPGPGVGGHCIPVDPYYLSWLANKNNQSSKLIYHAGKINSKMPGWIISQIPNINKMRKILIIGAAYKKDLDDTRESPAIKFINILEKKKIKLNIYDPYIKFLKSRNLKKKYVSVKLEKKILKKSDCVIILTDHSNINYHFIYKYSNLIIDTRNIYKIKNDKILKL